MVRAMLKEWRRVFLTGALCLACSGVTFVVAKLITEPASRVWFYPGFLRAWLNVGEGMTLATTYYVEADAVSPEKLAARALAGVPAKLDSYSAYLPPQEYDTLKQRTQQTYVGIGILWRQIDGYPVVLRLLPDGSSPANGLQPGDRISTIDGADIFMCSTEVINTHFLGKEGEVANVTVYREGQVAPLFLKVVRRRIRMSSVVEKRLIGEDTGYLRVSVFENRTAEEISAAIESLTSNGAKRLVLDLRDNPGGLVSAAVDTVGLFCPKGTVAATLQGRIRSENVRYETRTEPRASKMPIAVLVNWDSASAAEIVAGALQDMNRAAIVGERTRGKGVVQTIFPLSNEDALKITTAHYVLPSGRSIQGSGVQPDIYQPLDRQTQSLLAVASAWAELGEPQEFERRYAHLPPEDSQLAAAMEVLRLVRP
jgi:carboxyl-terminal processing protease